MALYQVGLLGAVDEALLATVSRTIVELVDPLGLAGEVLIHGPGDGVFDPPNDFASAALFFGADGLGGEDAVLKRLMRDGTLVIPVVTDLKRFASSVPACLLALNGMELSEADVALVSPVTAALEVLGLLPRQRRVFISYKRTESTEAALQLFEHLASRKFDVFLDTHGVPAGEDFQEVLWHRLSDSDVLVMLDTPGYFESRWTTHEFGRALAKSLVPLRLGWPEVKQSIRSMAAESIPLTADDFEADGKHLARSALETVGLAVERSRSRGLALRCAEMNGAVVVAAKKIGGEFLALGPKRSLIVRLPSGHTVLVYPSVGVPTAEHLYEASRIGSCDSRAVVFDDIGVARHWQEYLDWLGGEVRSARFLRKARVAWDFAAWEGAGT